MTDKNYEKESLGPPPDDQIFDSIRETVEDIQVLLDRLKSAIGVSE